MKRPKLRNVDEINQDINRCEKIEFLREQEFIKERNIVEYIEYLEKEIILLKHPLDSRF